MQSSVKFGGFLRGIAFGASALFAAATLPATAQDGAAQDGSGQTVITAARYLDVQSGKMVEHPAIFVGADGRIASIADARTVRWGAGVKHIDLGERTLLPGLIDLHVHLTGDPGGDYRSEAVDPDEWGVVVGAKNARVTLRAGFTTVREAGSAQYTAFSLRRGTAEGFIEGPRIVAAGPPLSIIGGHGDVTGFREDIHAVLDQGYTCTGAVECAEKVRKASRAGADVIKITATGGVLSQQGRGLEGHFTSAELQSIADTAHSLGLKVMAHAHGARGIESAAAAGIDRDGRFRIDDIPPGHYELTVTIDAPLGLNERAPARELGRVKVPVDVPEGNDDAPVDLGEIPAAVNGR